ncbi:MAG: hypothetical protein HY329_02265 [Chloroflexi bacterium]|nr:hypothetical protein [Chloroflexota bacterium]
MPGRAYYIWVDTGERYPETGLPEKLKTNAGKPILSSRVFFQWPEDEDSEPFLQIGQEYRQSINRLLPECLRSSQEYLALLICEFNGSATGLWESDPHGLGTDIYGPYDRCGALGTA